MSRINLVLPAAGLGSRFRDIGELRPKPLIPVFDLPMIMWVLLNFPLKSTDKAWVISQEKDGLPQALAGIAHMLPFEIEFVELSKKNNLKKYCEIIKTDLFVLHLMGSNPVHFGR